MEHSKLPWEVVKDKESVEIAKCFLRSKPTSFVMIGNEVQLFGMLPNSIGEADANADFLVKACNYHQDLMDACRNLLTDEADKDSVWRLLDEIERSTL